MPDQPDSVTVLRVTAIHHVAIQTSDLDRAIAFYVDLLGAELLVRRPFKSREMAWLRIGSLQLELFSARRSEQLQPWSDDYSGPVHLALVVDDVDAFLAAVLARGGQLHPSHPAPFVPPVPGAGKIAYLLGPDGEEVEIRTAD